MTIIKRGDIIYIRKIGEITPGDPQATYTVTFNNVDGTLYPNITVNANHTFTVTTPTMAGSTFLGWYTDNGFNNEYVIGTPVTSNLNLYAKWKADDGGDDITTRYTVSFNSTAEARFPRSSSKKASARSQSLPNTQGTSSSVGIWEA